MSMPSTAEVSVDIDAPPADVYDLVADITRMGEWSPECVGAEWVGTPGAVGARFKGRNRRGLLRWTTTVEVLAADRPTEFAFATLNGQQHGTRWRYRLEPNGEGTRLTESFEAVSMPWIIAQVDRFIVRTRQEQLEASVARTLAAIKAAAEA